MAATPTINPGKRQPAPPHPLTRKVPPMKTKQMLIDERAKQLDVEYGQLQIELSTWATSPRIEKIAREKLRMRAPEAARVLTARSGGEAP